MTTANVKNVQQTLVHTVGAGEHSVSVEHLLIAPLAQLSIAARRRCLRLLSDSELAEFVNEPVLTRL